MSPTQLREQDDAAKRPAWVASPHAIDRWVERVPSAKRGNATEKLAEWANAGLRIGDHKIQFGSFILIVHGSTIQTVHRITKRRTMGMVYCAHAGKEQG